MGASAAIYGLSGLALTDAELAFFREADPWGFILFARNIDNPDQVRNLTTSLRDAVGRDAPVLIDQEGGRVQRMRPPHWAEWPPMRDLCEDPMDEMSRMERIRAQYTAIAVELASVGIDVNCAPVLDVPQPDAHPIIGDRAFGWAPGEVALRGREAMAALLEGGVLPVIKHLPGHGRALADSHADLPRVGVDMDALRATDFLPFRALRDAPLGMTAHIVYEAIDPENCATLSPLAIKLIREEIGFDGFLMTDDLSMHALTGPFAARATGALDAGCDVILHCNGILTEMSEIASVVPDLTGQAAVRAERALAARERPAVSAAQDLREVANG
ncbi:MAG: beta-N-acetylhexosaminidase [Paracoccaceae bacterium]